MDKKRIKEFIKEINNKNIREFITSNEDIKNCFIIAVLGATFIDIANSLTFLYNEDLNILLTFIFMIFVYSLIFQFILMKKNEKKKNI